VRSRARNGPKARATDEAHGDLADVERYEQLRTHALSGGGPSGWRHGLALLQRRGVAAWARAWRTTLPAPVAGTATPTPVDASDEIVGLLATMALACVAGS
jgi:hypothetical protein